MVNILLTISGIFIFLSLFLTFIRFVKGPTLIDRTISFDVMTISSIALIGLISHFTEKYIYLDVALIYGLMSFLGIIVIAKYLEKGL